MLVTLLLTNRTLISQRTLLLTNRTYADTKEVHRSSFEDPISMGDTCLIAPLPKTLKMQLLGHPTDQPPCGLIQDDIYGENKVAT